MEKYEIDSEAVFNLSGINKSDLTNISKRIDYETIRCLWEHASELIDDPCFGIRGIEVWHPSDLGALGYAWLTSATLRDALVRFKNFIRIATELYHFKLIESDVGFELIFHFLDKETPNMAQVDASMAIVMEMCRINLEKRVSPISVSLIHPEPVCKQAYQSYYGCPVFFSCDINKIILPSDIIDTPLFNSDPNLALLNDQAIVQYLKKLTDDNIVSQVKIVITEHLSFGITNEQVAYALNMSERTMNRHLREQGYTFKDILKDVRMNLSKLYIKNNQFNVTEIAFQLGFADSSSFSRAFKRWTGTSPKVYSNNKKQCL